MVLRLNWLTALITINLIFFSKGIFAKVIRPDFRKIKIEILSGKTKKLITVEAAETPEQHAHGLMFKEKLGSDEGMIFIFEDEAPREFWMKNTLVNLDIGFFDSGKKLVDIQQMAAVTSILQTELPTYPSKLPAKYALEMPKGWFKKNKISEGSIFKIVPRP